MIAALVTIARLHVGSTDPDIPRRAGRAHPRRAGRTGHRSARRPRRQTPGLAAACASASALAGLRWQQTCPVFFLGAAAFALATTSRPRRRPGRVVHVLGTGGSYLVLLTAFFIDNGPNLPLWRHLPALVFWLGPVLIGLPLLALAAVALLEIPAPGRAKHRLGARLGSRATTGEGTQSSLCGAQAAAMPAGLAVTAAWHGAWCVDAVIGLAIAAASAWEGAESWRGGECGC